MAADVFAIVAPWLTGQTAAMPTVPALNAIVVARGILTGNGRPLQFVTPGGTPLAYEERAWSCGEVEMRADNWHDAYNALIWLTFPRAKAALNARHARALALHEAQGNKHRGRLRDALTQFDECGLVVACADMTLWEGIRAHRWREVFAARRADVYRSMRFFLFGHGSFDALRAPFVGLTAKALCCHVDADWLTQPLATQLAAVDIWLAASLELAGDDFGRTLQPVPLLGIPGVATESENPDYYDDTRQFRPKRPTRE